MSFFQSLSVLQIVTLTFEALLGVFSLYSAYTLFAWKPPSITKAREALRYPRWYWSFAGLLALIGGAGLLVGLAIPFVAALAAIWMSLYFVAAMITHLIRKDFATLAMPFIFLLMYAGLVALRWADVTPLLHYVGL